MTTNDVFMEHHCHKSDWQKMECDKIGTRKFHFVIRGDEWVIHSPWCRNTDQTFRDAVDEAQKASYTRLVIHRDLERKRIFKFPMPAYSSGFAKNNVYELRRVLETKLKSRCGVCGLLSRRDMKPIEVVRVADTRRPVSWGVKAFNEFETMRPFVVTSESVACSDRCVELEKAESEEHAKWVSDWIHHEISEAKIARQQLQEVRRCKMAMGRLEKAATKCDREALMSLREELATATTSPI